MRGVGRHFRGFARRYVRKLNDKSVVKAEFKEVMKDCYEKNGVGFIQFSPLYTRQSHGVYL